MNLNIENRPADKQDEYTKNFSFNCAFDVSGVWAGMSSLLEELWPAVKELAPHLIEKHRHGLKYIVPWLTTAKEEQLPLTETVTETERVRSYAADRALRIPHDIACFIAESKRTVAPHQSWNVEFYNWSAVGESARILIENLQSYVSGDVGFRITCFNVPPVSNHEASMGSEGMKIDPATLSWETRTLDYLPVALRLPLQIQEKVRIRLKGVVFLCSSGFYYDAARYADGLITDAFAAFPDDRNFQWHVTFKCVNAFLGAGQIESAAKILEEVCPVLTETDSKRKSDVLYLRAMIYARFRSPRDFQAGETCLHEAIDALDPHQLSHTEYHFSRVFLANGIAMIRMFQGRLDEALEITLNGIQELDQNLEKTQQRLHRSVLVYNVSQVYARLNRHAEALDAINQAIDADPYYSEYYNDRGSINMALHKYDEAIADYCTALTLSAPYYEALTNLGQCYRATGRYAEALNQFERAVLMAPEGTLALVGAAACCQALGRDEEAIGYYDRAIELSPSSWELLANRAASHYALDRFEQALSDMDLAIELNPDNRDLLENRIAIAEAASAVAH